MCHGKPDGLAFGFGQLREAENLAFRPQQEMAQIVGFLVLVVMMSRDEVVFIENPAQGKWQILVGSTKGTSVKYSSIL